PLHLLPTLWYRNTWSWGRDAVRPLLRQTAPGVIEASCSGLGTYWLAMQDAPEVLFTENDTNAWRLWGVPNASPYVKDGINAAIVDGASGTVNPARVGTRAAAHYVLSVASGATQTVLLRLSDTRATDALNGAEGVVLARRAEADEFYASPQLGADRLSEDERRVQRQAFGGLLWSKQFYQFKIEEWLDGDPAGPTPPAARKFGRNSQW